VFVEAEVQAIHVPARLGDDFGHLWIFRSDRGEFGLDAEVGVFGGDHGPARFEREELGFGIGVGRAREVGGRGPGDEVRTSVVTGGGFARRRAGLRILGASGAFRRCIVSGGAPGVVVAVGDAGGRRGLVRRRAGRGVFGGRRGGGGRAAVRGVVSGVHLAEEAGTAAPGHEEGELPDGPKP